MNTTRSLSTAARRATRAAVPILAVAMAAVAPGRAEAQTDTTRVIPLTVAKQKNTADLLVENGNWLDAHLYLVREGMLTSLGFVGGLAKEHLVLPSLATSTGFPVQILVLPIGSTSAYVTPDIMVNPGDQVELMVENQLSLSAVMVRPTNRHSSSDGHGPPA
ncbi:MAG: hypothetical protein FIA95_02995 [Gemmatimonadetes bacterium]|nr:hypothetical protein [Gemmatimonadota bacterium]